MTRIHKTVLLLVAAIALVLGLTVSKVLNAPAQLDTAALADAGIILLPQSRALPALSLTDENGAKSGDDDKRCVMEARLNGLRPITVTHRGATVDQAVSGAAHALERTIDSTLGRLHDHKGRTPYGGEPVN